MQGLRASAIASALGSLSTAVAIFLVFRISLSEVGASGLGLWALMQGLFFIARVADSGLGVNLTRRSSLANDAGSDPRRSMVSVGLLLGTLPVTVLGVLSLVPVTLLASRLAGPEVHENVTLQVGATCLLFGVFSSGAGVVGAVCDGLRRIVERNVALTIANVVLVASVKPATSELGIVGIGVAYCLGAACQCALGLMVLSRTPPNVTTERLSRAVIGAVARENAQLFLAALTRLSLEPITKLMLSWSGSLALVAAFDLALKVTTQARILIQSLAQPLITFAAHERGGAAAKDHLFQRYASFMRVVVPTSFGLMLAGALTMSWVAFGRTEPHFVAFILILALGNAVNSAGLLPYFGLVTAGRYGTLLRIQVAMAIMNGVGAGLAVLVMNPWAGAAAYSLVMGFGGVAMHWVWSRAASTTVSIIKMLIGWGQLGIGALTSSLALLLPDWGGALPLSGVVIIIIIYSAIRAWMVDRKAELLS